MTEPNHHHEAELLLRKADLAPVDDEVSAWYQRQAQVHATLAVADRLDQMIDAWRTRIESVPTPNLVDVATATAIIRRAGKVQAR